MRVIAIAVVSALWLSAISVAHNAAEAAQFQHQGDVFKIDLSHGECQNVETITSAIASVTPPPYSAIAEVAADLIQAVDAIGGNNGVTITGVGTSGVVITPRDSIPVYQQAISAENAAANELQHWSDVASSLGDEITHAVGLGLQGNRYSLPQAILSTQLAYRQILGRPADPGGLKVYVHSLMNGFTVRQVIESMATSEEYRSKFVANLSAQEIDRNFFRRILAREIPYPLPGDTNVANIHNVGWVKTALLFINCKEYNDYFGDDCVPPGRKPVH